MDFGKLHAELMLEFHNSREMADRNPLESERFRSRADLCFMFGTILGGALSPEESATSEQHQQEFNDRLDAIRSERLKRAP